MIAPSSLTDAPKGCLATIVTTLEMRARPAAAAPAEIDSLSLKRVAHPASDWYRALYRAVGEDWLWVSRLVMSDGELRAILGDGRVEVNALMRGEREIGLLELDFREAGQCELAFLGLVPDEVGKGAGGFLMRQAIARAWSKPISRFWVHTCTLDHPRALGFYRRSGFIPVRRQIEILPDPRLTGILPRAAAPQVPVIE